ncbi:hypothetical protein Pyn_18878 [Prunus yedoensis var. nudiflora]|uniref:Uncharacterized protein n=1 Tax=Prunus yedoensis var. nudiflora TaxID=2094558 RepID=A0A314XJ67_PRUYE|nr:hypothetical protein Pyn_18878 [Prunus yedoensis var. nudiflora]
MTFRNLTNQERYLRVWLRNIRPVSPQITSNGEWRIQTTFLQEKAMQQEQWTQNWQYEEIRIGTDCCRLSAGAKKYIGREHCKIWTTCCERAFSPFCEIESFDDDFFTAKTPLLDGLIDAYSSTIPLPPPPPLLVSSLFGASELNMEEIDGV